MLDGMAARAIVDEIGRTPSDGTHVEDIDVDIGHGHAAFHRLPGKGQEEHYQSEYCPHDCVLQHLFLIFWLISQAFP